MRLKINRPLFSEGQKQGKNYHFPDVPCGMYGNREAAKENLTDDQNHRRELGLFKTWGLAYKKQKGVKALTKSDKKIRAIKVRHRYKEKVAREAREIQDIARRNAADAMKVATEIMSDPLSKGSDRLAAANLVLDRAYGKAAQLNVNDNVNRNGSAKEASAAELDQRVKAALNRVEELTGRATEPDPGKERPANVRKRHRDPGGASVH